MPQKSEFSYCEITRINSSESFLSKETDTNVGLKDHRDIISPITNCKIDPLRVVLLNHFDNIGFLARTHPTADDSGKALKHFHEPTLDSVLLIFKHIFEGLGFNDQSWTFTLKSFFFKLIGAFFVEHTHHVFFCSATDYVFHAASQQLGREPNALCGFKFVSSQNCDVYFGLMQCLYGLNYLILKAVFHNRCPKQVNIIFQLTVGLLKLVFPCSKVVLSCLAFT